MERDIKNKKQSMNMMKKIMLLLVFLFSVSSIYSVNQETLFYWDFEEGSGDIVFDDTGNNINGLMIGGGVNFISSAVAWGDYAVNMQGTNDYIDSLSTFIPPSNFSVSFWANTDAYTSNDYWLEVDGTNSHFEIEYLSASDELEFGYVNSTGDFVHLILDNVPFSLDTYYHIVVGVDKKTNTIKYWRDNVLTINQALPGGFFNSTNPAKLRIGANHLLADDWDGRIDELRTFNFIPNTTQVNNLYTSNTITLQAPTDDGGDVGNNVSQDPEIAGVEQINLINSLLPVQSSPESNPVNFQATLFSESTCSLYIDNKFVETFEEVLSFSEHYLLSEGIHDYFVYCENINTNNTLQYELSNTTSFSVVPSDPSEINFYFSSTEFVVNDYPLFMITPCVDKGIWIPSVTQPYSMIANPNGIYFTPVINGQATFNMTEGDHEFCLIHGSGQYNVADGFSDIWYINDMINQLQIGEFNIPSNVTKTFAIKLETGDIYKLSDPKWWGTSWVAIITGIIGLALGLCLIGVGVVMKLPQAIVIGGIVALISLGFEIAPLILGIVT